MRFIYFSCSWSSEIAFVSGTQPCRVMNWHAIRITYPQLLVGVSGHQLACCAWILRCKLVVFCDEICYRRAEPEPESDPQGRAFCPRGRSTS